MDSQLTIAIVEDHDDLREAMVEALSSHGHRVMAMPDAERFTELAASSAVDIVIIDWNLPGEDGISLTQRLRQANAKIGLVVVSARGLVQEKTKGYQSGADIYLTKPVALQELVAAVQSLGSRLKTPDSPGVPALLFGSLTLVCPTGDRTPLPWHEAVLLRALIIAPENQVDYWQLIEAMGKNPDVYAKSALELVMVRLRKRMQSVGFESNAITAVRSKGYRLLVAIRLL